MAEASPRPRRPLRPAAALLVAHALAACGTPSRPPDVVLMVLDTVRHQSVSIYGNGRDTTPRLDELGRAATVYERAYAQAPWTLPSHASLFTGLYPVQHLAVHEHYRLDERYETLAESLATAGYDTACFVANPNLDRQLGLVQGFSHYRPVWPEEGSGRSRWRSDEGATAIDAEVRLWLDGRDGSRPFFLFANYMEAHRPYTPPADYRPRLRGARRPEVRFAATLSYLDHYAGKRPISAEEFALAEALYEGEIRYLDTRVGALLEWMEDSGHLDEALLIVTSDHGEHFGEHGGLVGHQFSLFDELLRVPLVIRFPDRRGAGSRIAEPVELVDVHATILAAAGIRSDIVTSMGRSLYEPIRPRPQFAEYYRPLRKLRRFAEAHPTFDASRFDHRLRSIRDGNHKLIWSSAGRVTLFDTDADPGELHDLATSHPQVTSALAERLDEWLERHGAALERLGELESDAIENPELWERLRALGYL